MYGVYGDSFTFRVIVLTVEGISGYSSNVGSVLLCRYGFRYTSLNSVSSYMMLVCSGGRCDYSNIAEHLALLFMVI